MRKKEKAWLDWFMDEFEKVTRAGDEKPIEDRVPWDRIEEKGIALKVVNTNKPGWFGELRSKWQELMPKKWCLVAHKAIKSKIPVLRPGETRRTRPPPRPPPWNPWPR